MTERDPRLQEFGGLTERGFNSVVDMLHEQDFHSAEDFLAWRTSLPRARNSKERRNARRAKLQSGASA